MSEPPSRPAPAAGFLPALDGLRAVAILLVALYHTQFLFGAIRLPGGLLRAARLGWAGVDLFFVISGMLITGILLRSRGQPGSFGRFWTRRALRIFPLAYLYLAFLAWCGQQTSPLLLLGLRDLSEWPWYVFYLANLRIAVLGLPGGGLGLLWSLAAEEQFYLVWPLVVLLLPEVWTLRAAVATVLLSPILRGITWMVAEDKVTMTYFAPWCRMDALALGAGIALAQARGVDVAGWARKRVPLALAVLGTVFLHGFAAESSTAPRDQPLFAVFGYSIVAAAFAVLVAAARAPGSFWTAVLANRLALWIGKRSYGIYIWHSAVAMAVGGWLRIYVPELGPWAVLGVWVAATAVVAGLSWRLWERPWLDWKDRLAPDRPA